MVLTREDLVEAGGDSERRFKSNETTEQGGMTEGKLGRSRRRKVEMGGLKLLKSLKLNGIAIACARACARTL